MLIGQGKISENTLILWEYLLEYNIGNIMIKNNKGFTLLEMLIVILAIGIIASIVLVNNADEAKNEVDFVNIKTKWIVSEGKNIGNLAGKWSFDEGSGNKVNDMSNSRNNLAVYGNPNWKNRADCIFNKCLEFDGVDDYASSDSSIFSMKNRDFSVSFWFKANQLNKDMALITKGQIFSEGNYSNLGWGIGLTADNLLCFEAYKEGFKSVLYSKRNIVSGRWYHVLIVKAGTNTTLFIDGIIENSFSIIDAIEDEGHELRIGRNGSSALNYFNGIIDEVSIYFGGIELLSEKLNYDNI